MARKVADTKVEQLRYIIGQQFINLNQLKAICYTGIPDESNLRPLCWRLLLNGLPPERSEWNSALSSQRGVYEELIRDFVLSNGGLEDVDRADHPLSAEPNSGWSQYFKDNDVLVQINRDVRRLRPEMGFFQSATDYPCKLFADAEAAPLWNRVIANALPEECLETNRSGTNNLVEVIRKTNVDQYGILPTGQEAHWQVVERILFIYYKLNPGVKYVQGMNEILGPIYYVFASDQDKYWREYAEADSYFCFQNMMSEIMDSFIKTLDKSNSGIEGQMASLYLALDRIDPQLYDFMSNRQELKPQYFAFRWLSLLFSQEFLLPDLIRLWDTLFADSNRFQMSLYVALAMLVLVRDQILSSDFSANVRLLQNYQVQDISSLVSLADNLRRQMGS